MIKEKKNTEINSIYKVKKNESYRNLKKHAPPKANKNDSLSNSKISNKILNKKTDNQNFLKNKKIKSKNKIKISSNNLEINKINTKKPLINDHPKEKDIDKNNDKIKSKSDKKNKPINDYELNKLKYELALKFDKRTYFQYYWSLCKQKQIILFAFNQKKDFNIITVKISLIIISFSLYLTVNGFFFDDNSIHRIYKNNKIFDFISELPKIIITTAISSIVNMALRYLALTEKNFLEIKNEKDYKKALKKYKQLKKHLKIRFMIFFLLCFLLMIFFWIFIACFCSIFINTQIILIKDTSISFALSMVYPFGLNIVPTIFRKISLKSKDKKFIYDVGNIIALII